MSKELKYAQDARHRMFSGIEKLAKAVMVTLGPRGRNVIIDKKWGAPMITKDGVTVAKEVSFTDAWENLGAQLVKEAATKTNDLAGDGTTTATTLAFSIIEQGLKAIDAGFDPVEVKKGIDDATIKAQASLRTFVRPVSDNSDLKHIATISANNDPAIGGLIAEAFDHIGKDGIITVEDSSSTVTHVDYVEGIQFDRGYLSPFFVNTTKSSVEYVDPLFMLIEHSVMNVKVLAKAIDNLKSNKLGTRPLVIIANDFSDEVLTFLSINVAKHQQNFCAIRAPGFGEKQKLLLEDMAIALGATVVGEMTIALEDIAMEHLGTADQVKVTTNITTIVGSGGDATALEAHCESLRTHIVESTSEFEREAIQERLAKLSGGVAIISVGASTEVELKEKKHRIEDALNATRAALEEGIVIGGGTTLLRVAQKLKAPAKSTPAFAKGFDSLRRALKEPFYRIAFNAGKTFEDTAEVINMIMKKRDLSFGWNALSDTFGNLYAAGVVDPIKVTRYALEHASSVGSLFLITECAIADTSNITVVPNGMPEDM